MPDTIAYKCTLLTTGAAGALDAIDGNLLNDGDFAFSIVSNVVYVHWLDADYGDVAESSPGLIKPDANYGTKMWVLANVYLDLSSPPAMGETAPNTIRGLNKEVYKTASADSPLTTTECGGTIVSNYGMTDADCVIDLATAAEGLAFVCILPTVRARYFRLNCPLAQADKINLLVAGVWVAGSDDGYVGVASGYAANDAISIFSAKVADGGYEWFAIPLSGTWVAG